MARSLGLGGFAVLFRVTLRQARAAIAAGALLVALYVLSDFGAVAAMRFEAFTWVIYGAYRSGFNPARAAVLSLVLLVFAVALVIAEGRARGLASSSRIGGGAPRPAPLNRLGAWSGVALLVPAAVLVAAVVVPAVTLADWLLTAGPRWDSGEWIGALGSTVVTVGGRRAGVHRGRPAVGCARRAVTAIVRRGRWRAQAMWRTDFRRSSSRSRWCRSACSCCVPSTSANRC